MDEVPAVDPAAMTGDELTGWLLAFETSHARREATRAAVLAEFDRRQAWAIDGSLCGWAWMRNRLGTTNTTARGLLRVARRLEHMPATAAAFAAGDLSLEKVRRLADCRTDITAEAFDRDESMLVDLGGKLDGDQFTKALRHWKRLADADGVERDAHSLVERRRASCTELLDGVVKVDATLDPEGGRIYKRVLDDIDQEMHRSDRRDAELCGDPGLIRTAHQRRADAMVEMARRAASSNPDTARRPRPECIVILSSHTLLGDSHGRTEGGADGPANDGNHRCRDDTGACTSTGADRGGKDDGNGCADANGFTDVPTRPSGRGNGQADRPVDDFAHLDNGAVITGEAARRLACDCNIVRAVVNGKSELLDLGRSTSEPSTGQRRATFLRDGSCTFAGCDMPAGRCDLHHFVAFNRGCANGGPTDRDNLGLLCPRHHHLVHEGGYNLSRNPHTGRVDTRRADGSLIPDRPRAGPLEWGRPPHLPFDL